MRVKILMLLCVAALFASSCGQAEVNTAGDGSSTTAPDALASAEGIDEDTTTTSAAERPTVRIAARGNLDASAIWIADIEDFFATSGVEVDFRPAEDQGQLIDDVIAGEVDLAVLSSANAIGRVVNDDVDLRFLVYLDGTRGAFGDERGSLSLVAPDETEFTDGCDLEGKHIGVDSRRSISTVAVRALIESAGCDPLAARLVVDDAESLIDQLETDEIHFAVLTEPYTTRSLRRGNKLISNLDNALCPDHGSCPLSVVVGRGEWVDANADAARKFARAIHRTIEWIRSNELEYRADLVRCCALTPDDAGEIHIPAFVGDGRDFQLDLRRLAKLLMEQGIIDNRDLDESLFLSQ